MKNAGWNAAIAAGCMLGLAPADALAWGPDGHAIVGEIAQRHLGAPARSEVERLLGGGHSLAAEATWADDVRTGRPETFKWHFVDIPLGESGYDAARDCRVTAKGDCIVAALQRARQALACGDDPERREALRWSVHLVADLHQPLHTLDAQQGGNLVSVNVAFGRPRCAECATERSRQNLHWVWDTSLIAATAWSWGGYVRRLEDGWLASDEARTAARGTILDWTNETHRLAQEVWEWTPRDRVIGEDYYRRALPVLDRQLGRAGLRLAAYLDQAFASPRCDSAGRRGKPMTVR